MNSRPRRSAAELRKRDLPEDSGVYAWYRDGTVAEHLGISTAARIKSRDYQPETDEVQAGSLQSLCGRGGHVARAAPTNATVPDRVGR